MDIPATAFKITSLIGLLLAVAMMTVGVLSLWGCYGSGVLGGQGHYTVIETGDASSVDVSTETTDGGMFTGNPTVAQPESPQEPTTSPDAPETQPAE